MFQIEDFDLKCFAIDDVKLTINAYNKRKSLLKEKKSIKYFINVELEYA